MGGLYGDGGIDVTPFLEKWTKTPRGWTIKVTYSSNKDLGYVKFYNELKEKCHLKHPTALWEFVEIDDKDSDIFYVQIDFKNGA